MKKLLLVLSVLWVASAIAEDSWLYWMIGNDSGQTYNKVTVRGFTDGDSTGTLLSLYYDSETPLSTGDYVAGTDLDAMQDFGVGLYAKLATSPVYSSYIIELWNDSKFVAQSETLSAAMAAAHIETGNSLAQLSAWAPTSYAIPEPNSAMLLLVGCAALALRRRRLKVA